MSTKRTIKQGDGYHMYTVGHTLFLELTDCDFTVFSAQGKSGVTVKLSEDMATRLGLVGWEGMAKWRT